MKIIFVCHGNICRSTMAEFVMKDIVNRLGLEQNYEIISRATSYEEEGNPIHFGTRKILDKYNVPYTSHYATVITKAEYEWADVVYCMDDNNLRNLKYRVGRDDKTTKLLDRNVADPYYTGDFESTYRDVVEGCQKLLEKIKG